MGEKGQKLANGKCTRGKNNCNLIMFANTSALILSVFRT